MGNIGRVVQWLDLEDPRRVEAPPEPAPADVQPAPLETAPTR
jgi:hypothetical protein